MGRYADFNGLVERYPQANTRAGESTIDSGYIAPAEYELDGLLSQRFTVPFSSNNITARDLAIDMAYIRLGIGKDDRVEMIERRVMDRIKRLVSGKEEMQLTDGTTLQSIGDAIYNTTEGYHTSFGPDDPTKWHVDSDWKQDVEDSRA